MNKKVIFLSLVSILGLASCSRGPAPLSEEELNKYADEFILNEKGSISYKSFLFGSFRPTDDYLVYENGKAYTQFSGKELPGSAKSFEDEDTQAVFIQDDEATYDVLGEKICDSTKFTVLSEQKVISALDNPELPEKFRTGEPFLEVFDCLNVKYKIDGESTYVYMIKRSNDTHYRYDSIMTSDMSIYCPGDVTLIKGGPSDYYFDKASLTSLSIERTHIVHSNTTSNKLTTIIETRKASTNVNELFTHYFGNGTKYSYSVRKENGITNKYSFYTLGERYVVIDSDGKEQLDIPYVPFAYYVNKDNSAVYLVGYQIDSDKNVSNKYYACKIDQDLKATGLTDKIEPLNRIGKEYKFLDSVKTLDENENILFLKNDQFVITRNLTDVNFRINVNGTQFVSTYENAAVAAVTTYDKVTLFYPTNTSKVSVVYLNEDKKEDISGVTHIFDTTYGLYAKEKELFLNGRRMYTLTDSFETDYYEVTSRLFRDGNDERMLLDVGIYGVYGHHLPIMVTSGATWEIPEESN